MKKNKKVTIDDLAGMFARHFTKSDKKLDALIGVVATTRDEVIATRREVSDLKDDVAEITKGNYDKRIRNLEGDMKKTKEILQFK